MGIETHRPSAAERTDRFGNRIDPAVGYARGRVLEDEISESLRQKHAHALIRSRFAQFGEAGIFNLTGLIRGYPFAEGDGEQMRSYVHFIARSEDELERIAIERMGGELGRHDGFLATRVTAGMLVTMLSLLQTGDQVYSLVAADRSHPSVRQAVVMAQGVMTEFTDPDAFEQALVAGPGPKAVVFTAISPSKNHLPADVIERLATVARARGASVVIDDAHMAARISLYDEPGGLALGGDIAIWSLDKHLGGPRSGFVAGNPDLIRRIEARALSLGVEAQLAQYVAGTRAVQAFDPAPIRDAARTSERILEALNPEMDGMGYLAGAGLAVTGEDFLAIAMRRAKTNHTTMVPIEAVSYASMHILEQFGGVMIPSVGMPGSACTFRIMLYPDGMRFGEQQIAAAWRSGLNAVADVLNDQEQVRQGLIAA